MRYGFTAFRCFLRCRLCRAKTWLLLLLLPVTAVAANQLLSTEPMSPVTVGVVLPADGTQEMWSLLENQNNDLLSFVQTDPATLDRNVAAGKWDCGLIFPEDFEDRIRQLELDRIVTLRISSGSAVYPLVQESVSSCLAQLITPAIAWDYLLQSQIAEETDSEQLLPLLEQKRADCKKVGVVLSTADGTALEVPQLVDDGTRQLLFWLLAAVILVRVLFASADLCRFSASACVRRLLPIRTPLLLTAARAGADSLLILLSGIVAMLVLRGGLDGCLALGGYTLFWLSASVFLTQFHCIHSALVVLIPFAPVVSFLLSSVAVDVSMILPEMAGLLHWIPVSLFLRTCDGDLSALAVQAAAAVICWLAAFTVDRVRYSCPTF